MQRLTEHHDLRSGDTVWTGREWPAPPSDPLPGDLCDVVVIGGGIVGAVIAANLVESGLTITVIDRRIPGEGSTAASTAQIMWAMDVPLSHLAARIGEKEAARRWRRVYASVRRFSDQIDRLDEGCRRADVPTVYLAGDVLDDEGLKIEAAFHHRSGLPTRYLEAAAVADRFGIAPRAALVSSGGYAIDPVATQRALLAEAQAGGAAVCFPHEAVTIVERAGRADVTLASGERLTARHVIIASGYERARDLLPPCFRLFSTFVGATAPGAAPLWAEDAMIWEASDPYLYARGSPDGRVLVGGEDVEWADPAARDAILPRKIAAIAEKASAMLGGAPLTFEKQWAAMFGGSPDGLPAIGKAANHDAVWLAYGFGGNGIAFAALAAEILAAEIVDGHTDADAACFDPYRFGPPG